MAEKIGTFKVNGTKVELDLDSIGSYIGNEPIKTYIDNHSGGTGGGKELLIFNSNDFYNQEYYNKIMTAYDEGGLAAIARKYEIHIAFDEEKDDEFIKADVIPVSINIDDVNRFVFFKCLVCSNNKRYIYSYVMMTDGGGTHTIDEI